MKILITLILFFFATTCFGQVDNLDSFHPSLRKVLENLRKDNVDTILTYHYYCNGCETLGAELDCEGFIDAGIIWRKNGKTFTKTIFCDQKESKVEQKNSEALEYFIANRIQITTRQPLPNQKFYPPISVHYDAEDFSLFLNEELFKVRLFKEQKEERIWRKYSWIKPTLMLSELYKKEKK
ncbi:hypothetical protein HUW51_15370 [Adhaeribacter swui]|uniref:Uncharacterized protein n=1 Tax=Adhaeribacter swui TaxID=2086471 RepID=A0A7G7GA49_9BACT|nr:hypothetical protein [Adhaeribacter swui]QNF34033.1 hypothetical protein HUW51_15370 [Adhaeribacter swui]